MLSCRRPHADSLAGVRASTHAVKLCAIQSLERANIWPRLADDILIFLWATRKVSLAERPSTTAFDSATQRGSWSVWRPRICDQTATSSGSGSARVASFDG